MILSDLSLWQRLKLVSLVLTIPCEHGWESTHCRRDDEGSCPYDPKSDCPDYCDQAIRWWVKR